VFKIKTDNLDGFPMDDWQAICNSWRSSMKHCSPVNKVFIFTLNRSSSVLVGGISVSNHGQVICCCVVSVTDSIAVPRIHVPYYIPLAKILQFSFVTNGL
jgi:hypothetical protein